ncbi:MAG: HAD family hydrolase [Pedobacter sp.]|nr:MAG: HAD family hydrolase [Pedobacter sp.]
MKIKALIFDLDDTIYATKSVVSDMYKDLFALLKPKVSETVFGNIQEDILTTPFHIIADRYAIDRDLRDQGLKICLEMDFEGPMQTFADYKLTLNNSADRYLVTAGYIRLQESKIRQLGIEKDFKEIFIPDPYASELTKTDVFEQILNKYNYKPSDVLVIGDNPESEIAAAKELGIATYLYDYESKFSPALADYYGTSYDNFADLKI